VTGLDYLSVSKLRQYLLFEFGSTFGKQGAVPFGFDIERVIDDFVFLCFFVGNDFLPHLPSLDIREGGLDLLLRLYKTMLPTMGGYMTDKGEVALQRLEAFSRRVALVEASIFRRRERIAESRTRAARNGQQAERDDAATEQQQPQQQQQEPPALAGAEEGPRVDGALETDDLGEDDDNYAVDEEEEEAEEDQEDAADHMNAGQDQEAFAVEQKHAVAARALQQNQLLFDASGDGDVRLGHKGWRDRYYQNKLREADSWETRKALAREYVRGLCWVARYYTQGCPSWHFYYPFHHAPFATDLRGLPGLLQGKLDWQAGVPFSPLTQLMAVLPPDSAHCLPAPFAALMRDGQSPISDFYPRSFELDPNGHPATLRWLWVARLPFIDAGRLRAALNPLRAALTEEERRRDSHGEAMLFVGPYHPLTGVPRAAANEQEEDQWGELPEAASVAGSWKPTARRGEMQGAFQAAGVTSAGFKHPPARTHSCALKTPERGLPMDWNHVAQSTPKRPPRLPIGMYDLERLLDPQDAAQGQPYAGRGRGGRGRQQPGFRGGRNAAAPRGGRHAGGGERGRGGGRFSSNHRGRGGRGRNGRGRGREPGRFPGRGSRLGGV